MYKRQVLKKEIKGKKWHTDLSVAFFLLAIIGGIYQFIIQREVQSALTWQSFPILANGFRIAVLSAMIYLIVYYFERRKRLKNLWISLRKQWKRVIPITFVLCVLFFFLLNEIQSQTDITRWLYVSKKMDEYPSDPKLWEDDFNRITIIANIFRAKIMANSPSYAYCYIAVPVTSYQILLSIYKSMGYEAHQVIPLHPC